MVADSSPAAASSADVRKEPFHFWLRWFSLPALLVLITDLVSKYIMFGPLADAAMPSWIRLAYNRGVAWSLFDTLPGLVVGLTVVLIPVLFAVWWLQYRRIGPWENLAFGAILGGAVGNAYDRISMHFGRLEGVRDFIHVDLGFWPFHPYPTFNIADSGICVGFVILVLLSFVNPPERYRAH